MDNSKAKRYYLFSIVGFFLAFIAGLAALINNLSTVINSEFILHANEYIFMFLFEAVVIVIIILVIPFIPKISKFFYARLERREYFKSSYAKIAIASIISVSIILLAYITYYHSLYYKRGMSIRLDIYEDQLVSKANSCHNNGAIEEAIEIFRRCHEIFKSYRCELKLYAEEDIIKKLDTVLWVYDITPDHSPYKKTILNLIRQLEGNKNISKELQYELERRIKHAENTFRDGLKAIKSHDYKSAHESFYQLNKQLPGYMNSHKFVEELQKIIDRPGIAEKLIADTTYVSTVMRTNSLNAVFDQLDIHNISIQRTR